MLQTNGGKEVEKGTREKKEIYWDKSLVSAAESKNGENERWNIVHIQHLHKKEYMYTRMLHFDHINIFAMHAFTFKYNCRNQYILQLC